MSVKPAQFPCRDEADDYLELGSYTGQAEEQVTITVVSSGREACVYLSALQAAELARRLEAFAQSAAGRSTPWRYR